MAEQAPPRHKRRTPPHKKHAAYPGVSLKDDVKVEHGSIRPLESKKFAQLPEKAASIKTNLPYELEVFNAASKALAENSKKSHNMPLAARNSIEWMYGYTYTKAMHKGLVNRLKRKYRG